eukprot:12938319-Prorocentrum_lima.AAC.1
MKHKQRLPALELPPGRYIPPAKIRRIFDMWIAEIAVKIGTWGQNAQEYLMKTVQQARLEHDDWLDLTPAQQA